MLCIILALFWLALAVTMQPLRSLATQIIRLSPAQQAQWSDWIQSCRALPGMVEVVVIESEGLAYLKMERSTSKHPDFLRLKEQLQS